MLITLHAPPDSTRTSFSRERVTCAGWFGAPIVNCTVACNCAAPSAIGVTRTLATKSCRTSVVTDGALVTAAGRPSLRGLLLGSSGGFGATNPGRRMSRKGRRAPIGSPNSEPQSRHQD